jgi:hypothetical protein
MLVEDENLFYKKKDILFSQSYNVFRGKETSIIRQVYISHYLLYGMVKFYF